MYLHIYRIGMTYGTTVASHGVFTGCLPAVYPLASGETITNVWTYFNLQTNSISYLVMQTTVRSYWIGSTGTTPQYLLRLTYLNFPNPGGLLYIGGRANSFVMYLEYYARQ